GGDPSRGPTRQPQRPLSAHAGALHADTPRSQAPAVIKEWRDAFQQVAFRRHLCVERDTNAVAPPARTAVRTDTGQLQLVEQAGERAPVPPPPPPPAPPLPDTPPR